MLELLEQLFTGSFYRHRIVKEFLVRESAMAWSLLNVVVATSSSSSLLRLLRRSSLTRRRYFPCKCIRAFISRPLSRPGGRSLTRLFASSMLLHACTPARKYSISESLPRVRLPRNFHFSYSRSKSHLYPRIQVNKNKFLLLVIKVFKSSSATFYLLTMILQNLSQSNFPDVEIKIKQIKKVLALTVHTSMIISR